MEIKKFHIYLVDLNPRFGTEPGKIRPAVVIQTDLLNVVHPSTIICPITTKIYQQSKYLRVHLSLTHPFLQRPSDIIVDQIRAIDNQRFIEHVGELYHAEKQMLLNNLQLILIE